jgi:alanyl-tRNA synthetase
VTRNRLPAGIETADDLENAWLEIGEAVHDEVLEKLVARMAEFARDAVLSHTAKMRELYEKVIDQMFERFEQALESQSRAVRQALKDMPPPSVTIDTAPVQKLFEYDEHGRPYRVTETKLVIDASKRREGGSENVTTRTS